MSMNNKSELIEKYNISGPRYTSYPTVPYWDNDNFTINNWDSKVQATYKKTNTIQGISIYIHLPFCETLCTFCACNKRITKNHSFEEIYISYISKEWQMYLKLFDTKPIIKEIHIGGGTPTFFSPKNLEKLITIIIENSIIAPNHIFSIEGHPNNTTLDHLKTLYNLGFNRISFGIQDYDPIVQKAINRIQSFENVERVTIMSREIGFESVSHDIIYGLPFQSLQSINTMIENTWKLKPDRISFYSYAHVPWIKGLGQRGFDEKNLPSANLKREMYETAKIKFEEQGYFEIGMDHFALNTDSMYKAMKENTLHRNFMGYSSSKTDLMIGLGVSSISDSWTAFGQNEKNLLDYYKKIDSNTSPIVKGHLLNSKDLIIRKHILNIMCNMTTSWIENNMFFEEINQVLERLEPMIKDDLIVINNKTLTVNENGRGFLRNVCMAFDLKLAENDINSKIFSKTI